MGTVGRSRRRTRRRRGGIPRRCRAAPEGAYGPCRPARSSSPPSPRAPTPRNPTVMVGPACWPGTRSRAGCRVAVGEDLARARLARRDRLPQGRRPHGAARRAALQPGRLRLHDLHRQLRPAGRADRPAIEDNDLVGVAVLSGNRNFEGRIHPLARASYLASPPLVVAFALAGRIDIDLTSEPLGTDARRPAGDARRLWPDPTRSPASPQGGRAASCFGRNYASVFDGDDRWRNLPVPAGQTATPGIPAVDVRRAAAVLRRPGRRAGAR
jgi:hypothetical protein